MDTALAKANGSMNITNFKVVELTLEAHLFKIQHIS
jgi:hypothetical protein